MSDKPRSTIAPLAAGASVLGICCGVPLLASAGVLGTIAGIGLGSWLLVTLAATVAVIGIVRHHRTTDTVDEPGPGDNPLSLPRNNAMSPTPAYRDEEES